MIRAINAAANLTMDFTASSRIQHAFFYHRPCLPGSKLENDGPEGRTSSELLHILHQSKGNAMPARKYTRQDLREAAEKYKNWGKWGPNDEIGTLNFTRPEDIVAAAKLVRKGKVISLA